MEVKVEGEGRDREGGKGGEKWRRMGIGKSGEQ